MARLPQLFEVADKYGLKIICIADIIKYRLQTESLVDMGDRVFLPLLQTRQEVFSLKLVYAPGGALLETCMEES